MRNERKFTADGCLAEFALAWLKHVCMSDSEFPAACISSIYFDTPDLASYQEKANGDFLKTKVRLRWYNPTVKDELGQITAFLEIKMKVGSGCEKVRKKILFPEGWLDRVDFQDEVLARIILQNVYELGERISSQILPVLTVRYDRERFVCPVSGARVSLDTSIGTTQANPELLPQVGPVQLETAVLEIKEDTISELPWLSTLQRSGFRAQSFSKYGMCMSNLVHGV